MAGFGGLNRWQVSISILRGVSKRKARCRGLEGGRIVVGGREEGALGAA